MFLKFCLFICLFFLGCAESLLLPGLLSDCGKRRPVCSCSFSSCWLPCGRAQALLCGLNNCGTQTQLLWGLWGLLGPPGTDLCFLTCSQVLYHWATREAFCIFLCISSCFFTISLPESILLYSLNILAYPFCLCCYFFNLIWIFSSFLLHWLSSENLATHKICIQYSFPSTCEKYCFIDCVYFGFL